MRRAEYQRLTKSQLVGRRVTLLEPIRTRSFTIPSGTKGKITDKWKGIAVEFDPCSHCGIGARGARIPPSWLSLHDLSAKTEPAWHTVHAENYSGLHCSMCCAEWDDKTEGCPVCEAAAAKPLPIEEAKATAKAAQAEF